MKKLILIALGLVFLSGCSGIKGFSIEEFTTAVKEICLIYKDTSSKTEKRTKPSLNIRANGLEVPIVEGVLKVAEANSKTGCSANVTPSSCSVSCGGADTPKIGK